MSGPFEPPDSNRLHFFGPTVVLGESVAEATCPTCDRTGSMRVTPFIWRSARQLQWHCAECRAMWVSPERRRAR